MSIQPQPLAATPVAQDERTLAFLAHLLQIFSGFIGPLVIFCVKQDSKFVRFHSLQALIWQICFMVLTMVCVLGFAVGMITTIANQPHGSHSAEPPVGFFVFFPLMWLVIMGGWVINLILAIVYGIKANHGEWAQYPIIGKWVLPKDA